MVLSNRYTALQMLVTHSTETKIGCSVHCKIVQIRVILKYKLFTLNYFYALELIIDLLSLKNIFCLLGWLSPCKTNKNYIHCCLLAVSKKCLHECALLRTLTLWIMELFSCSKIPKDWFWLNLFLTITKGQLILKCLFGVIVQQNKNIVRISVLKFFVASWGLPGSLLGTK